MGLADWIGDADGGTSLGGEVRSGEAGRTEGWVATCGVWIPRILHSFLFCLSVNLATKKFSGSEIPMSWRRLLMSSLQNHVILFGPL